jgi:hypothetical protein
MPRHAVRILTAVLVLAAVPHHAFAQAGRVGGGAPAPVGGIGVAPAVVPHVPPPVVAPAIVPHVAPAPPVVAPALRPITLPSVHAPSVGVIPPAPRVSAPVGTGIRSGLTGHAPAAPIARPVAGPPVSGATRSPDGHRLRHHRIARGVNPGLLWDDPGTRAACGWYWLKHPGHRRLHLYRC